MADNYYITNSIAASMLNGIPTYTVEWLGFNTTQSLIN